MADPLSTMENVIVNVNRVQLQSSNTNGMTTTTHSGTSSSSGQTDCTINSNHSHFDAENIVSSTQETTNETILNEKLNSERTIGIVNNNKCDEMSVVKSTTTSTTTLPKSMANEKQHINSEESHVHKASALSSQSRKAMDESKHQQHLHNSDSSKMKTKPMDSNGEYSID